MVLVPVSATDDELLALAREWIDVLASENFTRVFDEIGYAMAYGEGASAIRRDIQKYRSSHYFPGVSEFRVTDWRSAVGGNPEPMTLVRRYKYKATLPIIATVEVVLPLNGRWSDLEADFVVTIVKPDDTHGVLWLEDIAAPGESDV